MGAGSKPTCNRSQLRSMTIAMTPSTWVIGIVVLTQFRGQPLPHAAMVAAIGALGGLITWAIYHAISRRDDGAGIFIVALGVLSSPDTLSLKAAVGIEIVTSLITVSLAALFIPLIGKARVEGGQATLSSLWDPDLDLDHRSARLENHRVELSAPIVIRQSANTDLRARVQ